MIPSARPLACELYFLPVHTRVPYGFGTASLTQVVCARVKMTVESPDGHRAIGWGETPLSVGWVWPGDLPFAFREQRLKDFCERLCAAWATFDHAGHALEVGHSFLEHKLPEIHRAFDVGTPHPMPHLGALVCCSAFDIAMHDAYGNLVNRPIYSTYGREFLNHDLSHYLQPAAQFAGLYPSDFLLTARADRIPVWHSVGVNDPLTNSDLTGKEPHDGYPLLLHDWIARDGLKCLKIKLSGKDREHDYQRIVSIGQSGMNTPPGIDWLCTDFNCTVRDPAFVNSILDQLMLDHPRIHGMILYVEQPFPHDLETHQIDVHSVSARKPLFMDESAHDWRMLRLGRSLGWTGVALKTCKTQTGAILSACWAKAHGMTLMVQDLTNPMLAMIPHAQLAAHVGTIMGLEANAAQFYPQASLAEAKVHPGLYERRGGVIDLSTVTGPGIGYRLAEMQRDLPAPAIKA